VKPKPTYQEIANDYDLWGEYVDPSGLHSRTDFDAMSAEEKIQFQVDRFGLKQPSIET
jgi:hypothetical protein